MLEVAKGIDLPTLDQLADLSIEELKRYWIDAYRFPPPKRVRRGFLERGVAYAIQVTEFGGLSAKARAELDRLARVYEKTGAIKPRTSISISPGTRLVRSWGGETHVVTSLEKGFEYKGARYDSLSKVAFTISGVKRSGPAFFGLTKDRS